MSDELRLPDDLAACEARLAAMSLPATAINCDELLYRAGWAAGAETARLALVTPLPSKGGARGGIIAAWSIGSSAIAATLAVAMTLQWRPAVSEQIVIDSPQPGAATTLVMEAPRTAMVKAAAIASASPHRRPLPTLDVGLLALRRDALSGNGALSERVASHSDLPGPAAKTARELLDEMLPAAAKVQTPSWPWQKSFAGDSI